MQKSINLKQSEAKAVDYIRRSEGELVGYRTLAAPLDMTKEGVRQLLKRMEEDGLVTLNPSQSGTRIEFTRKGAIVAANIAATTPDPVDGVDSGVNVPAPVDVHHLTVRVSYENGTALKERYEDWRGAWTEKSDYKWLHSMQNSSFTSEPIPVLDNTIFNLYRDAARIICKRPAVAYSVPAAMREVRDRVKDSIEWLNARSPAVVNPRNMELETTHAAAINHHLAQLVDQLDGISKEDVTVIDREDGTTRVEMEQSRAWPELEFKGAGTAPVDLDRTIEDWLDVFVHEPDVIRALKERGRELASGHEREERETETAASEERQSSIQEHLGWGWEL